METVMESTFYMKDDIDNLIDDIIKKALGGRQKRQRASKRS